MVVRELLTRLGFTLDEAKVKTYEQKAASIADGWGKLSGLFGAAMGIAATIGISQIAKVADEWSTVESRVALATKSAAEQEQVLSRIYEISNDTRQAYTATADLYEKVAKSADELKISQADVLKLTDNVNKAMVIGGGSAGGNQAAILQLGQALASGELRGDELNSIMEQAPRLAKAIAQGMGVSIGKLREMGRNGEMTAEKVVSALLSQGDVLTSEFAKMPMTVGQAMTVAGNMFGKFISRIGKETGIFKKSAQGIVTVARWVESGIDLVAKAVGGLGNLMKIAGLVIAAFSAGLLAIKWGAIKSGIIMVRTAAMSLFANPIFLAWAAGIAALILIFDELYTWIQGGDSLIGDWIGSWEEVKAKVLPEIQAVYQSLEWLFVGLGFLFSFTKDVIVDSFLSLLQLIKPIWNALFADGKWFLDMLILVVRYWRQVFTGEWGAAIDTAKAFFSSLGDKAIEIMRNIGSAIAQFVLSRLGFMGKLLAKLTGIDLPAGLPKEGLEQLINMNPSAMVPPGAVAGGGRGGMIQQNIDVSVEVPPGTSAQQAGFIQDTAEMTYSDVWGGVSRGLAYGSTD